VALNVVSLQGTRQLKMTVVLLNVIFGCALSLITRISLTPAPSV